MIEMCLVLFCYRPMGGGPVHYPEHASEMVYVNTDEMIEAVRMEYFTRHWFTEDGHPVYCLEEDVFGMNEFWETKHGFAPLSFIEKTNG